MQNPREIRSFRLSRSLLGLLRVAARQHGISENALAEKILERYLSVEPMIQGFDYVAVGKDTFASILGMSDANGLEITGAERGWKAFSLAKELFESVNIRLAFPQYLSEILGGQARWFRVEGMNVNPERITLQHSYGLKWSGFLKSYLSSAYELASRNKLELTVSSDYVGVRFPRAES